MADTNKREGPLCLSTPPPLFGKSDLLICMSTFLGRIFTILVVKTAEKYAGLSWIWPFSINLILAPSSWKKQPALPARAPQHLSSYNTSILAGCLRMILTRPKAVFNASKGERREERDVPKPT